MRSRFNIGPGGNIFQSKPSVSKKADPPIAVEANSEDANGIATQVQVIHHDPDGHDYTLYPQRDFTVESGNLIILDKPDGSERRGEITIITIEQLQGKPWFIYSRVRLSNEDSTPRLHETKKLGKSSPGRDDTVRPASGPHSLPGPSGEEGI